MLKKSEDCYKNDIFQLSKMQCLASLNVTLGCFLYVTFLWADEKTEIAIGLPMSASRCAFEWFICSEQVIQL